MKKILMLLVLFLTLTSFGKIPNDPPTKKIKDSTHLVHYPCHPGGDIYPCSHPLHSNGDLGPCTHYDIWGNRIHVADVYPCSHPLHSLGDLGPCIHVCF